MNVTWLQEIYDAALEISDESSRRTMLDGTCAGDGELRARVEELLGAYVSAEFFFTNCSNAIATTKGAPDLLDDLENIRAAVLEGDPGNLAGSRIGPYKLLELIGEGGCGAIYMAEQDKPVHRRVALKVIKLGMDTKNVIARFEAERQALALMDHPNIARVLDAGATETGRPYFVMELVRGVKITTYCDERNLDARQRLELFVQVCHAVQHAHQKGVIHRDIKPSNILVTMHDGVPVPKVIDFGIAKAVEGKLTDNTLFTAYDQFIGTPAYMSPEQAEMSGLDVDTRSDIYSLGVLLYELLTGKTPFDQKQLIGSGLDEMRRTLREKEPQRPSTMVTSLHNTELTVTAQHRHVEPLKLALILKGDLDWVVMQALEKDRRRRYDTANGLAADVLRYMRNEPVTARPPSRLYRLQKLIQRNKIVFIAGVVVVATLVAGLTVSTWLFLREREARIVQVRLRQEADQARANEAHLRLEAEAREKVTQATVLVSHGKMQEADDLLAQVPAELFSPSTEATAVFRTLGEWNILNGHWKAAADRYVVLVKVNQVDKSDRTDAATRDLLFAAPLLIESGDVTGYDRIRRMELARLADTSNPIAAEQLIKISLLLPADASVMRQLEPLAQVVSDSLTNSDPQINGGPYYGAWRSLALGMLEYRRGNYSMAANWLQKSLDYSDPILSHKVLAHLILGMACRQSGQSDRGATELDQAREMVKHYFDASPDLKLNDSQMGQLQDWLMARILLREADSLAGKSSGNTTVIAGGSQSGGPVLHLSFDHVSGSTVINDGTGGPAMNGTLHGSATIVPGGKFGNCLQISGTNAGSALCRIADPVVPLDVGVGKHWTLALWIRTSAAGGCYAYQGDGTWQGSSGNNVPASGNTAFYLNNGTNSNDSGQSGGKTGGVRWSQGWETGTATINDGQWHQVVLECNGMTKMAYVDGNLDSLTADNWNSTGSGGQFWIGGGGDMGDGTANLNGLIDEVYVFNRALSRGEIQALYDNNSVLIQTDNPPLSAP
jgi:serine/threonine protein kinase/tetratricopeptide (TPR) repeat protein